MPLANLRTRRDTAANFAGTNPILPLGVRGYETDNNRAKVGNGVNRWNDLPYEDEDVRDLITAETVARAAAITATEEYADDAVADAFQDPVFTSASHANTMSLVVNALTAARSLTAPDKDGTIAVTTDIETIVNGSVASFIVPAEGTFLGALTFETPGTSSFAYASRNGFWYVLGGMVFWTVYFDDMALTKGDVGASQELRVDLSGLGVVDGSSPFTPVNRIAFGGRLFGGSNINRGNLRVIHNSGQTYARLVYESTTNFDSLFVTAADMDDGVQGDLWLWGAFQK